LVRKAIPDIVNGISRADIAAMESSHLAIMQMMADETEE